MNRCMSRVGIGWAVGWEGGGAGEWNKTVGATRQERTII